MRAVLREPLVHFLLVGALLFGVLSMVRGSARPTLSIPAREIDQLVLYWEAQAQRPPTAAELRAIIQERVDEELLAREAQRLGLDRGDMIVRRRLAQKMAFASEDTSAAVEPSAGALQAFYDRARARYAAPARVALRHVFFSADRGAGEAERAARDALTKARAGQTVSGDPSLLPLTYADVSLGDLARDYGGDFAQAIARAPTGVWAGPVRSGYGLHLIRVERRDAAQTPSLDAVRTQVRDDYLAEQRKRSAEAFLAKLRARYRVEVAGVTR